MTVVWHAFIVEVFSLCRAGNIPFVLPLGIYPLNEAEAKAKVQICTLYMHAETARAQCKLQLADRQSSWQAPGKFGTILPACSQTISKF